MVKMAIEKGRDANDLLKIGVCGARSYVASAAAFRAALRLVAATAKRG